jgi:hypothetical protein
MLSPPRALKQRGYWPWGGIGISLFGIAIVAFCDTETTIGKETRRLGSLSSIQLKAATMWTNLQ